MKRRGFFKAFARAVAIVALAPQIAFNRPLPLPVLDYPGHAFLSNEKLTAFWLQPMFPCILSDENGEKYWVDYSPLYKEYRRLLMESNAQYRKLFDLPAPTGRRPERGKIIDDSGNTAETLFWKA